MDSSGLSDSASPKARIAGATAVFDAMVRWRRHLHRNPEVGIELPDTHAYIATELRAMGVDLEMRPGTGVTARIAGHDPDGTVCILRADMDALPLPERSGEPFASGRAGAMHACGHDLHMAMLLGAARAMVASPPRRDTVLAFQPGEEADRGALATLQHSALRDLTQATAFAIHVNAVMPAGTINLRPGTFMGFGDWFTIEFTGRGGHASAPELVGNPIDAAAETVRRMHAVVEELAPTGRVVATVTEVAMGNTVNVIPAAGRMRGTIRAESPGQRDRLIDGMRRAVTDVADILGLDGTFTLAEGYPAVVNDSAFLDGLVDVLGPSEFTDRVHVMPAPSMVIEDFAYFLQRWPGAMVYLGAQVDGHTSFNHSDDVVFDEAAMMTGAALHLIVADGFA